MTVAETSGLTPWAEKQINNTDTERRILKGVDSVEGFGWLHLPCGDSVVTIVDKKAGTIQKVCNIHNVSSAIETLQTR